MLMVAGELTLHDVPELIGPLVGLDFGRLWRDAEPDARSSVWCRSSSGCEELAFEHA